MAGPPYSYEDHNYSSFTRNVDMLTALKPSLEHGRNHVQRLLRLYGDHKSLRPVHTMRLVLYDSFVVLC